MNAQVNEHSEATLVASSEDAMALSKASMDTGDDELADHWARFAKFLVASETYVGLNPA